MTYYINSEKHAYWSVIKSFRLLVLSTILKNSLKGVVFCGVLILNTQAFAQVGQGYAWADKPSHGRYSPNKPYSFNSAKKAITAIRRSKGVYQMVFSGLGAGNGKAGGHTQVTSYGNGNTYCKVIGWNSGGRDFIVNIACFSPNGLPADSRYTVKVGWPVLSIQKPSGSEVVKMTVLPNGDVQKILANGTIIEQGRSGKSIKLPGKPKQIFLFSTQVPPAIPASYPDVSEKTWLDYHNKSLLGTIESLLNNDQTAI